MNPDQTVEAAVKDAEKAAGAPIKLKGFVRFALGEGVEKKTDDFAAEVASMTARAKPANSRIGRGREALRPLLSANAAG